MQADHTSHSGQKDAQSACVLAALPIATLVDLLQQRGATALLLGGACLVFLWQQRQHAKVGIRRTSAVLLLLSLLLLPLLDAPVQALTKGLRIGALIASLLIAVGLLSRASLRVTRMHNLMVRLFELPARQRPLALSVASQFFGGFLGLAGLAAMMEIASQREGLTEADKIADFGAISRGYAALSLWSPMYSNMSIVLGMYGDVRWTQVLPLALLVAALLITLGVLLERLRRYHRDGPVERRPSISALAVLRESVPIVLVMLCFVGLMVCCSDALHLPISALIIFGAPLVAWSLNAVSTPERTRRWRSGASLIRQDLMQQRLMAGEVMLFIASGCAGVVISQAIPIEWAMAVAQLAGASAYLSVLLLIMGIVLLSSAAIHPMLSAIVVGSMLSPDLLGLPSLLHVCAVLIGWGLAIIVTPFSVISLMAARFSRVPVLDISLKNNASYLAWAVGIAVAVLGTWASWF